MRKIISQTLGKKDGSYLTLTPISDFRRETGQQRVIFADRLDSITSGIASLLPGRLRQRAG